MACSYFIATMKPLMIPRTFPFQSRDPSMCILLWKVHGVVLPAYWPGLPSVNPTRATSRGMNHTTTSLRTATEDRALHQTRPCSPLIHTYALQNKMPTSSAAAPSSASAAREPSCPSLPPELWILIFSHHDPLHLWTTCRNVSSLHRSCAESAFAKHFLRAFHISFHLDRFNLGGRAPRPEVPVHFERLEDQDIDGGQGQKQSIAVFADKRPWTEVVGDAGGMRAPASVRYEMIQARWAEIVRGYRVEMPGYTVWMEGAEGNVVHVNDTELPRLEIDVERREVRFEWREMLSLFFREWKVLEERLAENNTSQRIQGKKGSPTWSTSVDSQLRRDIRRARLKEHYTGDQRMQWAVDCLKYFDPSVESGSKGTVTLVKMDPDLPGARLGERWFGSNNVVKELFLDEWSCMHRIEGKVLELQGK